MRRVVLLLLLSIMLSGCSDDGFMEPPEEDGVFLIPNKSTYSPGDSIEVTLTNRSDNEVTFRACGFFGLYRFVDDHWVAIEWLCTSIPEPIEVPARGTVSFSMAYASNWPPSGTYRVGEEVCDGQTKNCSMVFSEQFSLQE